MRIVALLSAVVWCAGVAGCSRLEEAMLPLPAKVNAAHPVAPEVKLASERLLALLADDPKALDSVKAQHESRMTLRALACAKDATIGRYDSVADVKKLRLPATCFQDHDRDLLQFYGLRTIGKLLAMPPLRPLKPVGEMAVLPRGKLSHVNAGTVARDANVALLTDIAGDMAVVELPGAAVLAQIPKLDASGRRHADVSPNGRIVAVGQGPVFFEAETGHRIWDAGGGGGAQLLAWLPGVNAVVISGIKGEVVLADLETGRVDPHPLSTRNAGYGVEIAGKGARLLLGDGREMTLVNHTRNERGIEATAVKRYAIADASRITSGQPLPMRSGRTVVYRTTMDLGWLDLDSGASGTWRLAPVFSANFGKVDETHLMVDSIEDRMTSKPWSLDIDTLAVAPLDVGVNRGMIVDIGDRTGVLRRGNDAWFGDKATASGPAQPMETLLAAHDLQQQLKKLDAESHLAELRDAERNAAYAPPSQSAGLDRRMPRAITRDTIPGLDGVPAEAEVHIVGVYEGRRGTGSSSGQREARDVRVTVRPSSRPIVLVLTAYEPVNWRVSAASRVSAVLISGYHEGQVIGLPNIPILRIGSNFAYTAGSAEYSRLREVVMRYVGPRPIRSFQGTYTREQFTVGGQ